jgi:non-specific protein-tyrosine kinase
VLLLTPQVSSAVIQANNSNLATPAVDVPTDTQIIESDAVHNYVFRSVPNAPPVNVAQIGTTNVVDVSVQSTQPSLAQSAANAYANGYIHIQQVQAVQSLDNASQIVQSHIDSVQTQINGVTAKIASASAKTDTVALQSQLTSLQTELVSLNGDLSNYQFTASEATGGGQVLSQAKRPIKPVAPKPVEYGIAAGFIGLILGVGLALLLEFIDERIRSREDLERVIHDVPVLGLIPHIDDWRDTHANFLVSRSAPKSPSAESYRSVRTSIQFLRLDQSIRTMQFTSPSAADGKTTTLANLAVTMTQAGQKVVVVCCDLRRPRIHEFFGLSNSVGFTSVLLGEATLSEAVQEVPGMDGLRLLASGGIPPNPSELLSSTRAAETLSMLADSADLVLIDSPPILPVTDAAVLASRVDGLVLVTSVGLSTRHQVARSLEVLRRVEAPLLGVVLNRASETDSYSYYRYSYGIATPSNVAT